VGRILLECPDLDEVEINPLRATADGVLALDAPVSSAPQPATT